MTTQRGFSIVELMVALTIGLLLLLALMAVQLSMSQTSKLRQDSATAQNNQLLAIQFLSANVRNAGYFNNPTTQTTVTAFPALAVASLAAGQFIGGTGAGAGTDTLIVRFVATGSTAAQGCTDSPTANAVYTATFNVAAGFLHCTQIDNAAVPVSTSLDLVSGLTGMNVLYGVDTSASGSVTNYLTASQIQTSVAPAPATLWAAVKTVKVTLLFKNPLAGQAGQPATLSFTQTIVAMNGP